MHIPMPIIYGLITLLAARFIFLGIKAVKLRRRNTELWNKIDSQPRFDMSNGFQDVKLWKDTYDAVEYLRKEEADSVTILCTNPDGPPNNAVECGGFWTGFETKRFEGQTLIAALVAATRARNEYEAAITKAT